MCAYSGRVVASQLLQPLLESFPDLILARRLPGYVTARQCLADWQGAPLEVLVLNAQPAGRKTRLQMILCWFLSAFA